MMFHGLLLLVHILFGFPLISPSPPHCVMRGICHTATSRERYPCARISNPQPLSDSQRFELITVCPLLKDNMRFCCDQRQAIALVHNLKVSENLLRRCKTCLENFRQIWCALTCSPRQSEFASVNRSVLPRQLKLKMTIENSNDPLVGTLIYHINRTQVFETINSCRKVKQGESYALGMMCGGISPVVFRRMSLEQIVSRCLSYWGTRDPPVVLYDTHFILHDDNETDMGGVVLSPSSTLPCHLSHIDGESPCPCTECASSCPTEPPMYANSTDIEVISHAGCMVLGKYDCVFTVVYACAVGAVVILIFVCIKFYQYRKRKQATKEDSPRAKELSYAYEFWGYPDRVMCVLQETARAYALQCWRNAAWMAGGMLAVAVLAMLGCTRLELETDPVNIWTSPQSVSRVNKDFYDKTFEPFPRYTQVLIVPSIRSNFNVGNDQFGPALRASFLTYAFHFTEEILNLTYNISIGGEVQERTLEDVCLRPAGRGCLILSPFGYFQNDMSKWRRALGGEEEEDGDDEWMPDLTSSDDEYPIDRGITDNEHPVDRGTDDLFGSETDWQQRRKRNNNIFLDDGADVLNTSTFYPPKSLQVGMEHVFYLQFIKNCLKNPIYEDKEKGYSCQAGYGAPQLPSFVYGGNLDPQLAHYYILTIAVDASKAEEANAWEASFLRFMKSAHSSQMHFTYLSPRSISDEVVDMGFSDIAIVIFSFLMMFCYVSYAIACYNTGDQPPMFFIVPTAEKVVLVGVGGAGSVLIAVTATVGIMSWMDVPITPIAIQVLPFLTFTVGANSIFSIVRNYQLVTEESGVDANGEYRVQHDVRVSDMCSRVLPSMFISTFAEVFIFLVASMSPLPALGVFSRMASLALLINFLCMLTIFLPIFIWDTRREGRQMSCECVGWRRDGGERFPIVHYDPGFVHRFNNSYFAVYLMKYRSVLIVLFFLLFFTSCYMIPLLDIGMDEKMSIPEGSYVSRHMEEMPHALSRGAPVDFVITGGFDLADPKVYKLFCTRKYCDPNSLGTMINNLVESANHTVIVENAMNWVDDYLDWLETRHCCFWIEKNHTYCDPPADNSEWPAECTPCVQERNDTGTSEFTPTDFYQHINHFLDVVPSTQCTKGGRVMFANTVRVESNFVPSMFLRAFHSTFTKSSEYIAAMHETHRIAREFTQVLREHGFDSLKVFPYCTFYVYYEQYLDLQTSQTRMLSLAMCVMLVFLLLTLGDPWAVIMIVIDIIMMLLDLIAFMFYSGIPLNALSIVNLAMSLGISLEFNLHFMMAYMRCGHESRKERAIYALKSIGPTVFNGVVATMLFGLMCLAFANSQVIKVFYFRFYLGIVLVGCLHGIVFLPVLLSYCGPRLRRKYYMEQQEKSNNETIELREEDQSLESRRKTRSIPESGEESVPLTRDTVDESNRDPTSGKQTPSDLHSRDTITEARSLRDSPTTCRDTASSRTGNTVSDPLVDKTVS